ncbi:MAG: helix-hairpin-helix domain-containing protein [Alphaproteobacteria bacterium]|nr:helix-hairpin-helix domain-containing protein [Alphaproteobacteria bacterium]
MPSPPAGKTAEADPGRGDRRLNAGIAERLREAADILEAQGANRFRINAYRRAAETVAGLPKSIAEIAEKEGIEGLIALPTIGESIAGAIAQIIRTGRWPQLERLRGTLDPEALFQTVPGIGPELARRLHDTLHVDTLEALETAAHQGELEKVPGIGQRRAQALRASLADALNRVRPARRAAPTGARPEVATLLDVDDEYRRRAAAGDLPTIAPKRFNPKGEAWLPILHTQRGDWHFTALFSNTALAHRLDRVREWVVVYFYDGDHREGQNTVVSETRGPLQGRRVVRGREDECRRHYASA